MHGMELVVFLVFGIADITRYYTIKTDILYEKLPRAARILQEMLDS